jgi:hypothetical protein
MPTKRPRCSYPLIFSLIFLARLLSCQEGRQCRVLCRLGQVNMAAADKVDVEFVSNIKELFMKQNKKL